MNYINIVVVCDNHYTILLAALIKSIELNLSKETKINIYIIEDNINNTNKLKLFNSINSSIFEINWIKITDAIPSNISLPLDESSWPLSVYARLFIPHFIEKNETKVIYLDVDMILQEDINKLWEINLNDKIIGAVVDPRVEILGNSWGGGIRNHKELNLEGLLKYFNTGILLIDLVKWEKENIGTKVVNCITDNIKYANFPDQYGLNVVLAKKWLELNPLWNHFSDTKTEKHPYLIHFIAKKPIYKKTTALPQFKNIFYTYLNQTEWKGFKSRGTSDIYIKKIRNKLIKKWRKLLS